jgi:hypothetical protein
MFYHVFMVCCMRFACTLGSTILPELVVCLCEIKITVHLFFLMGFSFPSYVKIWFLAPFYDSDAFIGKSRSHVHGSLSDHLFYPNDLFFMLIWLSFLCKFRVLFTAVLYWVLKSKTLLALPCLLNSHIIFRVVCICFIRF